MLTINNLTYIIKQKILFNDLNITLLNSSILYLKGENGTGKTTLLKIIAGLQRPQKGEIFLGKSKIPINNLQKPYCTYIGHNLGIKLELTIYENLKFWCQAYNSIETLEASLHYFNLYSILNKKCYELSLGNQKKVALAKLLCCPSPLWLLDEIESSLDENNKNLINNLIINKANNGGIVIMATHQEVKIKSAQVLKIEDYINAKTS